MEAALQPDASTARMMMVAAHAESVSMDLPCTGRLQHAATTSICLGVLPSWRHPSTRLPRRTSTGSHTLGRPLPSAQCWGPEPQDPLQQKSGGAMPLCTVHRASIRWRLTVWTERTCSVCPQLPTAETRKAAKAHQCSPHSSRFYQFARLLHATAARTDSSAAKDGLALLRHIREGDKSQSSQYRFPPIHILRASLSRHSRSTPGETDPPAWSPTRISSSCESSPQWCPSPVRPGPSRPLRDPIDSLLLHRSPRDPIDSLLLHRSPRDPIDSLLLHRTRRSGSDLLPVAEYAIRACVIDQHGATRAPRFLQDILHRTLPKHWWFPGMSVCLIGPMAVTRCSRTLCFHVHPQYGFDSGVSCRLLFLSDLLCHTSLRGHCV